MISIDNKYNRPLIKSIIFHNKSYGKVRDRENILNIIKAMYDKLIVNIMLNGEKFKIFPQRSTRQVYPLSSILFTTVVETLARVIRREENKRETNRKGRNGRTLFAGDRILYIRCPQPFTIIKNLLELINTLQNNKIQN